MKTFSNVPTHHTVKFIKKYMLHTRKNGRKWNIAYGDVRVQILNMNLKHVDMKTQLLTMSRLFHLYTARDFLFFLPSIARCCKNWKEWTFFRFRLLDSGLCCPLMMNRWRESNLKTIMGINRKITTCIYNSIRIIKLIMERKKRRKEKRKKLAFVPLVLIFNQALSTFTYKRKLVYGWGSVLSRRINRPRCS